ncbi:MAG: hypothetical protein U1D55_14910 [Phycisphaerae bacterium]
MRHIFPGALLGGGVLQFLFGCDLSDQSAVAAADQFGMFVTDFLRNILAAYLI